MNLGLDKRILPGYSHLDAMSKYNLYDTASRTLNHSTIHPQESHATVSLPFFNDIRSKENAIVSDSTWSVSTSGSQEERDWSWFNREQNTVNIDTISVDGMKARNFESSQNFNEGYDVVPENDSTTFIPLSMNSGGCGSDPLNCKDSTSIFRFRAWQCHVQVASNFVSRHIFITSDTRCSVVSWMRRTANHLSLRPETLFLAVNLADRYLGVTRRMETIESYRRIAIASVHAASKYEENRTPGLGRLIAATGMKYTPESIVESELILLATLGFRIGGPTVLTALMACLDSMEPAPGSRVVSMCYEVAQSLLINESVAADHMPCDIARAIILSVCRLFDPNLYDLFWYRQIRLWGKDGPLLRASSLVSPTVWMSNTQKKDSSFIDYLACLFPDNSKSNAAANHDMNWSQMNQKMCLFS